MQGADGQHGPLSHGQLSGVDLLEAQQNVGGGGKGIDPGVGHGAVAALALDLDLKIVCRRCADARGGDNDRARLEGHGRHHVDHQSRVYLGVFQKSRLDHVVGALKGLF